MDKVSTPYVIFSSASTAALELSRAYRAEAENETKETRRGYLLSEARRKELEAEWYAQHATFFAKRVH